MDVTCAVAHARILCKPCPAQRLADLCGALAAKCVNQICGVEAFGCPTPGCDKGGITYRFVSWTLDPGAQDASACAVHA